MPTILEPAALYWSRARRKPAPCMRWKSNGVMQVKLYEDIARFWSYRATTHAYPVK